jgi:hypothetical protein
MRPKTNQRHSDPFAHRAATGEAGSTMGHVALKVPLMFQNKSSLKLEIDHATTVRKTADRSCPQ